MSDIADLTIETLPEFYRAGKIPKILLERWGKDPIEPAETFVRITTAQERKEKFWYRCALIAALLLAPLVFIHWIMVFAPLLMWMLITLFGNASPAYWRQQNETSSKGWAFVGEVRFICTWTQTSLEELVAMPEDLLKKLLNEKLVQLALELRRVENRKRNVPKELRKAAIDLARNEFVTAHTHFKLFPGLIDSEYDSYFDKAEELFRQEA